MKRITLILWLLLSTAIWTFAYDFKSGDLYYNITSDSTATVTYQEQYSSDNYAELTSAVIPESVTYNGTTYRVMSIGEDAFSRCSSLTSVTIPNSVTSIGSSAFRGCSGLTSVTIGNSVTDIGKSAFSWCSSLTSVTIPNSVTSIGDYALLGCSGLTFIMMESGNKVYDSRNNCNAIIVTETNTLIAGCQNTTIPNSVTSIGSYAFEYCSSLTSITIPNSITSIGRSAFYRCSGLTSVVWNAESCENFSGSYGDAPFSTIGSQITSFTFGDEVEHIPAYLCRGMTSLTSITIPNGVTSIGDEAFSNVPNIVYFGTLPDAPWGAKSMNGYVEGDLVYSDATKKTLVACSTAAKGAISIPNSVTSIGGSAFSGCSGLTSITIPNSVKSIGDWTFYGCSGLTSIAIPNSVTSIGGGAFSGCNGLTSITIPNSVTSIEWSAFSGCSSLTSITIPNSVTSIGGYAFEYCSSLTSITIPNSITSIGRSAFFGCGSLTSVTWNAKNYADCTSGATPFYYSNRSGKDFDLRSQITSFVFGDSVQHIPAYICNGMDKLVSIHIGKDVMSIGNYALAGCTSLSHVKWNAPDYTATNPFYCESVGDTIGFDLRKQITSFVCGDSVYAITPGICYQMVKLDTLVCPAMALESEEANTENYPKALKYVKLLNGEFTETIQSILSGSRKTIRTLDLGGVSNTEIPDEAFREFYKMDTLVLPAQLTKIPYKAVSECVALQSIVVPEGVTEIEYGAFSGCSGLQTLTLPSTLLSIADNAFASCSALQEMRVHAQTPPTVYANTFSGVKRTIPVYVPQSAYNDYTAAEVWKEFFIQGDVADSVENTPANDTRNQDVRKVFRNGQVYILRGDKTYTLTGEEL